MTAFSQKMELVLQLPDVLPFWPNDKIEEKSKQASIRMMIQDSNLFPKWKESPINLETGTIHTIMVRYIINVLYTHSKSDNQCFRLLLKCKSQI